MKASKFRMSSKKVIGLGLILLVLAGSLTFYWQRGKAEDKPAAFTKSPAAQVATPAVNYCATNEEPKLLLISVSKRHLWACSVDETVYDAPVITGMQYLAADLTPPGSYSVYAKETNRYLSGSDSTGSWNDYVYYWMPFLDNQYGTYGFHDATWRNNSEFGNVDPNSSEASHGCVELTKEAAAWIYDWSPIGTAVTVES